MVPITILIIEDEKQIARFLELELKHEGYAVEIEYDGRGGLKKAEENEPDLILLDIMLPGINGMEVCRRIRQFSEVPVIMLTARDETTDKVMGLDSGANDYVTKPFVIEELLARIRAVLRNKNQSKHPQKNIVAGDLKMDLATRQVFRGNESIDLTKKEYDLLVCLLSSPGRVYSREELLTKIWGYEYLGDTRTVDVHVRHLRQKIELDSSNPQHIETLRGIGYRYRG